MALGEETAILSKEESDRVFGILTSKFPITPWGSIDWDKVSNHVTVSSHKEIAQVLMDEEFCSKCQVYVLWDDANCPVALTQLHNVFDVLDDVLAVSFDTWLLHQQALFVIEFHHEGSIRIGWN